MGRESFEATQVISAQEMSEKMDEHDAEARAEHEPAEDTPAPESAGPSPEQQRSQRIAELKAEIRKSMDKTMELQMNSPAGIQESKRRSDLRAELRALETSTQPVTKETLAADAALVQEGAKIIESQKDAKFQERAKEIFDVEQSKAADAAAKEAVASSQEQVQLRSREALLADQKKESKSPEVSAGVAAVEKKQRIDELEAEIAALKRGEKLTEAPATDTRNRPVRSSEPGPSDAKLAELEAKANQLATEARKENGTVDLGEFKKAAAEVRERRAEITRESEAKAQQEAAQTDDEKSEAQLRADKLKRDVQFLTIRLGALGASPTIKRVFGRTFTAAEMGFADPNELITPEGEAKLNASEVFKASNTVMKEMMTSEIAKLRAEYGAIDTTKDNVVAMRRPAAEQAPDLSSRKAA
ncbi:MAG: hypothetical protein AAB384_03040 [Patescibacteria group bacterium]